MGTWRSLCLLANRSSRQVHLLLTKEMLLETLLFWGFFSLICSCWQTKGIIRYSKLLKKSLQIARYEIMPLVQFPVENGMWDVSEPTKEKVLCMCEFSIHKRCQIDSLGDCGDWNFIYPWSGCSADCSGAEISGIVLLFHPASALHWQPLGTMSSFVLWAPSNTWLPKGCEGGALCVVWVLVSWNLNRCGRNLITSASPGLLEQRQPSALCALAVCKQGVSGQKMLVVMVLLLTDPTVLLQRLSALPCDKLFWDRRL